ncbi:MAG TPA: spore coat protein YlbD [Bacillales bacterium]|nr:spore coat protein YlbD [Bacillales bacterium]
MVQHSSAAKVARFKEFAREHPGLIEEVRNQKRSWQDIYEEWDIYGGDANIWEPFKTVRSSREAAGGKTTREASQSQGKGLSLGSLFSMLEKIDFDQFQKGLSQASHALESVQKIMGQSQNNNAPAQNQYGNGGQWPYGNNAQGPYGNGAPGPYGNRPAGPFGNGAPGGYGNGMPGPYQYNPQGFGPPGPQGFGPNANNMGNNNNVNNANNGNNGNNS